MDNPANGHGGPVTSASIDPKPALRAALRRARTTYGARTMPVPAAFLALLRPGLVVASYVATTGEADPSPLADAAAAAGCGLALPHVVDRAGALRFINWQSAEPLTPGPFGLRQPDVEAGDVSPDIVLAPLLGFDRAGNRLGQGAGHYDRAFAACPRAIRIGVAYAVQETVLAPDPWDVPLHAIATDREWIEI